MSNAIFRWAPQLVDYQEAHEFRTLKSEFENASEQRRYLWDRPRGSWTFRYEMLRLSRTQFVQVLDEIYNFFVARKGMYDNFWLPSWQLETELASNVNGTTVTLTTSPADCGFSAISYAHGNFIYITNRYSLHTEDTVTDVIRKVSSINEGNKQLVLGSSVTFSAGAKAMKAYKVRFASDTFERTYLNPYAYTADIQFVEDIAGYSESL